MFWASPATAVFIPITSPSVETSGPPEFPELMAASVCTRSVSVDSVVVTSRPVAETMPVVTVSPPPRSSALPMVMTSEPTAGVVEASVTTGSPAAPSSCSTATSRVVSDSTTVAE